MISEQEINEIKEHLERAQNPVFFFDNDSDGLCSFLLLRKYIGRGKGVAIKSFPDLDASYFRKVHELNADYIFVLDKPLVSKGFLEEVRNYNIPIVWIDHHEIKEKIPDFINYYNPTLNGRVPSPVTYISYQISRRRGDMWIAVAGCISDKFIPDFYQEFMKIYPELGLDSDNAFDIFYKSEIGKIAKIFNFALKDRTTNVVNMTRFLIDVDSPYHVLEEVPKNYTMHQRFKQIDLKYQKLLKKAISYGNKPTKILFFQYGGDLSISSDLSNELSYLFPEKIIVVIYLTGVKANISVRGIRVREMVLKSLEGLNNATGGGHEDAVGAQMRTEDLERFRENLNKLVEQKFI